VLAGALEGHVLPAGARVDLRDAEHDDGRSHQNVLQQKDALWLNSSAPKSGNLLCLELGFGGVR
jgi:hypothetical protein